MPAPDPAEPESENASWWRFVFKDGLPLERETAWFILANVLDFFVTYLLLRQKKAVEANPIARWFLDGWGPLKGLLYYKLGLVAFVCVIVQIIARKREDVAQKVLIFGTIVVGAVVIYSVSLGLRR